MGFLLFIFVLGTILLILWLTGGDILAAILMAIIALSCGVKGND